VLKATLHLDLKVPRLRRLWGNSRRPAAKVERPLFLGSGDLGPPCIKANTRSLRGSDMRWSIVCLATACAIVLATLLYGRIPATTREGEQDWRQRELAFLKSVHDRMQTELAHESAAAASLRREHRSILQAMAVIAKPMSADRVPDNVKTLLITSDISKEEGVASQIEAVVPERSIGSPTNTRDGSDPRTSTGDPAPPEPAAASIEQAPPGPVVLAVTPTSQPLRVEPAAPRTLTQLEETLHAEKTDRGLRIRLPADVLFGTAHDRLDPAANPSLSSVIELIRAMQPRQIVVVGHTDASSKHDADLALSKERAHAVSGWLRTHGLDDRPHLVAQGYGGTRPVAPNEKADGSDNPEGREQNRRIEILLRRH
jgi:outer membrane protein OmpA-like peptidoglycan-associated protein